MALFTGHVARAHAPTCGKSFFVGFWGNLAMDRKDIKLLQGGKHGDVKQMMIAVDQIRMHPTFVDLLPIREDLLSHLIQDMREHGYYLSKPVVLGIWKGLDEQDFRARRDVPRHDL